MFVRNLGCGAYFRDHIILLPDVGVVTKKAGFLLLLWERLPSEKIPVNLFGTGVQDSLVLISGDFALSLDLEDA